MTINIKNMLKKAGALLLAGTMTLGMAASVAAAEPVIDGSKTGSLTIHKYDEAIEGLDQSSGARDDEVESAMKGHELKDVEFTLLRVGSIETRSENISGTEEVSIIYGVPGELAELIGLENGISLTDAEGTYYSSEQIMEAMEESLSEDNSGTKDNLLDYVSHGKGQKVITDEEGIAVASDLELGLYLVVESAVPQNVTYTTDPFFVSIPMTVSEADDWNYDIHVYPKNNSEVPTIDKLVKTDHSTEFADHATASVGDIYDYRVVSYIPQVTSETTYYTKWTYTDTLERGIEYLSDTPEVTVGIYANEADAKQGENPIEIFEEDDFTVNANSGQMLVTLSKSGLEKINSQYAGNYIGLQYQARLNENAVLGDRGNDNRVKLNWKRTSQTAADTMEIEDGTRVYSFGLDITKLLSNGNADADLSQVKFTLYDETMDHSVSADQREDGSYLVNKEHQTDYIFSATSKGKLIVNGLAAGTYTLTEVKTITGYSLLKEPVIFTIESATVETTEGAIDIHGNKTEFSFGVSTSATATVDGKAVTMTAQNESASAYVPVKITNTKTWVPGLPSTGDRGTTILVLSGFVMLLAAGVLITAGKIRERRRVEK